MAILNNSHLTTDSRKKPNPVMPFLARVVGETIKAQANGADITADAVSASIEAQKRLKQSYQTLENKA